MLQRCSSSPMPRAAAAEPNLQSDEPPVVTTLHTPGRNMPGRQMDRPSQHSFESAHAVATAFITNLSGGAACYDVDLSMVAKHAVSSALTEAIADMRRLMAFADTAGWRVVGEGAEDAKTVKVVAQATNGTGDDVSSDSQEFTLHVDLTNEAVITAVDVADRLNTVRAPAWGMIASPDDVAAMASATGRTRVWRPGAAMAGEDEECPLADS